MLSGVESIFMKRPQSENRSAPQSCNLRLPLVALAPFSQVQFDFERGGAQGDENTPG